MVDILTLISECVIAFTGVAIAIVTLRKDSKQIAHRLLAVSTLLIGMYGASIAIYDIAAIGELVHFLLRFGIISLLLGVIFLYFTFQVIIHTASWLDRKLNTWPYLIGLIIYAIVFYAWRDAVTIVQLTPVVDSQVSLVMIGILGVWILIFLLATIIAVYRFGIKPSEGVMRKKMTVVVIGFLICLVALFVNIASNLVAEGALFDILFFLILAGAMIVIAYGFIKPVSK